MSTAAVATSFLTQPDTTFFQQRSADLTQLRQDLQSGNLTAAQQDFSNIQSLAQNGPFGGDAFEVSARQQDFSAIGQALQSGNLSGAQQALSQLWSTFSSHQQQPPPTEQTGSSTTTNGPEIVLNLGSLTPGEQVTFNVNNTSNGTDQVTVGVASQQGQNPEQITFNLNPNSNQEIVLNLLNGATSTTSSQTPGSGVSVNA
jgi:hypothetical protein